MVQRGIFFSFYLLGAMWDRWCAAQGSSSTTTVNTKKLTTIQELQNGFDRLFPQPVGLIMSTGEVVPFSLSDMEQDGDAIWSVYNVLYDMFGGGLFKPVEEGVLKMPNYTYQSSVFFESFPETSILPAEVVSRDSSGTYVLRILVDNATEKNITLDETEYMELEEEGEMPFSLLPEDAKNKFSDVELPVDAIVALVTEEDKIADGDSQPESHVPKGFPSQYGAQDYASSAYSSSDTPRRNMYGYRDAAGYPLGKKLLRFKSAKHGLAYSKARKFRPLKKISATLLKKRKQ